MAKLKFTIHPLFIAFGIYFAIIGKVFSFLIFTISAVIHEMGHQFVAQKRGYTLKRLVLMPYGAVIYGENSQMTYEDEMIIAISGPIVSLLIASFFVSIWWLVPLSYPYTELCVLANLTIGTVNLLPAYPLDGGRVLLSMLSIYIKRKTALIVCKVIGILLSALIFAVYVYSWVIKTPNHSILFFALFMLFGNIFVSKDNSYQRILSYFSLGNLSRGKKVNKIALSSKENVKKLQSLYTYGELLEVDLYNEKNQLVAKISADKVVKILASANLYQNIYEEYKKVR